MKNKIIIIEGAQGVGKTTVTNMLREQIPYSNLYRLSGIEDKSFQGLKKVVNHYFSLFKYLEEDINNDFISIFDRSFITEMVYSSLGYTSYNFYPYFKTLLLNDLFKEGFVSVYLLKASKEKFKETLVSHEDKVRHANIEFSAEESFKQQETYISICDQLQNFGLSYETIDISDKTQQDVVNNILLFEDQKILTHSSPDKDKVEELYLKNVELMHQLLEHQDETV